MESYVSLGLALPLALQRVDESLYGDESEAGAEAVADVVNVPSPAENDMSLAALTNLLGGINIR